MMSILRHRGNRALRPVAPDQVAGVLELCAIDPTSSVSLAHQLQRWPDWGRGDVMALGAISRPVSAAWTTGSVLPFGLGGRPEQGIPAAGAAELRALAEHARPRLARRGSVCGPARDVEPLWGALRAAGLAARHERWRQPVLCAPSVPGAGIAEAQMNRRPSMAWAGRSLRAAAVSETHLVLPASVDMFIGELGYDPTREPGSYAKHVGWLVANRRTYIVLDDGAGGPVNPSSRGASPRVAFKADVGALWRSARGGVAQLTGVWTRPDLRGRGLGAVAMAAVVDAVRRDHVGPDGTVSLYVNDFNVAALALYQSVGFRPTDLFATILL